LTERNPVGPPLNNEDGKKDIFERGNPLGADTPIQTPSLKRRNWDESEKATIWSSRAPPFESQRREAENPCP